MNIQSFLSIFLLAMSIFLGSCNKTNDIKLENNEHLNKEEVIENYRGVSNNTNSPTNQIESNKLIQFQNLAETKLSASVFRFENKEAIYFKNLNHLYNQGSVIKLFTATEYLKQVKLDSIDPKYKTTNLDLVKRTLLTSNNQIAEYMGSIVGVEKLQEQLRKVNNDKSIVLGNASGCNLGMIGIGVSGCIDPPTPLPTNLISVKSVVNSLPYVEEDLKKVGTSFEEVSANLSKYVPPKAKIYGKGGTLSLSHIKTLAGYLITKSGKKVYFSVYSENKEGRESVKDIREVLTSAYENL
jgi:D-alanyl-D-alanine carboxypeptidase